MVLYSYSEGILHFGDEKTVEHFGLGLWWHWKVLVGSRPLVRVSEQDLGIFGPVLGYNGLGPTQFDRAIILVAERSGLLMAAGLVTLLAVYVGVRMDGVHSTVFLRDCERRDVVVKPVVQPAADGGRVCRKICDVCNNAVHCIRDCHVVAVARQIASRGFHESGVCRFGHESGG